MDKDEKKNLDEIAYSFLAQKSQIENSQDIVFQAHDELDKLGELHDAQLDELDALLLKAQNMANEMNIDISNISEEYYNKGVELISLSEDEKANIVVPTFEKVLCIDESVSWSDYINNVRNYGADTGLKWGEDPFYGLLTETERQAIADHIREDYSVKKANCDKLDYGLAAFSGLICGLIDVFFVGGNPAESKLGNWTDAQTDKFVENVAHKFWRADEKKRTSIIEMCKAKGISANDRKFLLKEEGIPYDYAITNPPEGIQNCIQYLEKKFGINYDARYASDLIDSGDILKDMYPKNHHIKSLAHSPDIIGLVFSLLDQFTGKASFFESGKIIRLEPKEKANQLAQFELRGATFASKLLCGTLNWFGHLCSDMAGSSGREKRGIGISAPFFELLQLCDFNIPDSKGNVMSIGDVTAKMFEKGYDMRFVEAQAIPVAINEVLIRVLWSVKQHFYNSKDWIDCIPVGGSKPELRRMLLAGYGTMCSIDATNAVMKSPDIIIFGMHLNSVAWARLGYASYVEIKSIYKEHCIDIEALDSDLEAEWKQILESSGSM